MAIQYGIFPSINGDRVYSSVQLAAFKKAQTSTGVFPNVDNTCEVSKVVDTMKTSINTGAGIIEGYDFINDSALELTHGTADATHPRIDVIALRLDISAGVRSIVAKIVKGTPAASPAVPSLTTTGGIYEIALAKIEIAAGVSTLNAATLTDLRGYAYANAQSSQIITGTYTGDGNASQTITLGFTPSAVLVFEYGSVTLNNSSTVYGGLMVTSSPIKDFDNEIAGEIVSNGFKVYSNFDGSYDVRMNESTKVFNYIAFR
jgi:hypothetical protein